MSRLRIVFVFMLTLMTGIVETSMAQSRRMVRNTPRNHMRVVHKVVVRKAHIHYGQLPRWGAVVNTLPATAVVIQSRRNPYYFHNGIYYARGSAAYTVVRPVRGIRIRELPPGYRTIVLGPRPIYYYYGTFYKQRSNGFEYEVIDAPEHAVVDALPDGYEVVEKNGMEYYYLDGVYYAEVDAPEFEDGIGYEVVKL